MDKKALFIFQSKCLVPVLACNGWSVTTVEGVGSVKEGVSPIQVDFTDSIVLINNLIVVAIIVIMAIIIVRPRW